MCIRDRFEGGTPLNAFFRSGLTIGQVNVKTYKALYPQVWAFENLYQAYRAVRRGKSERAAVADWQFPSCVLKLNHLSSTPLIFRPTHSSITVRCSTSMG